MQRVTETRKTFLKNSDFLNFPVDDLDNYIIIEIVAVGGHKKTKRGKP
jgi:hypothetical protein